MTPDVHPITENQARAIAREAVRGYRNRALVGFAVLLVGLGAAYQSAQWDNDESRRAVVDSGQATSITSCNRDFGQTRELRTIIATGLKQTDKYEEEGLLNSVQADRSRQTSKDALKRLPLPDCREAGSELTSDPDEAIRIPEPLHP